jgi:methionyl-tRNA formyltransferase
MARIIFMGTPRFAAPTLNALADAHQVVGVVTQPDRPAGRGRDLSQSAVKTVALQRGLPLFQPRSLRISQAIAHLSGWDPEVIVVAAFGQILSQEILDLPPGGCLNVHASLLPRWRGAAPVAAAILAGDKVTGVTIMKLDAGLDSGPIVAQRKEAIRPGDTRATLSERLSRLGAELLVETLPAYLSGDLQPEPQSGEEATFADRLRKRDGQLDWSSPATELDRKIRAFTPWPGTFTFWKGRRLKIVEATPKLDWEGDATPGTVVALNEAAAVATGQGALRLEEVQLAGKRAMKIQSFLRGHRGFVNSRLGGD